MIRKLSSVLFGLLFLAGFGILAYPTVSDQWNTYRQSKLISDYNSAIEEMEEEDFDNDRVDAGEIGSGHSVTALYEIIPAAGETSTTKLKYQETKITTGSSELLTVKLRYKAPNGNTSKLLEYPVEASVYQDRASDNLTFACAVAEFGMLLRDSEHKGSADFEQVMELAESCVGRDTDDYKKEFLELVRRAADIYQ